MARSLRPAEPRATCDPATLGFRSTAELPPLDGMIGQERAVAATTFGIAMRRAGYNLFVLRPPRTGKATTMRRVLDRRAAEGTNAVRLVLRSLARRDGMAASRRARSTRRSSMRSRPTSRA